MIAMRLSNVWCWSLAVVHCCLNQERGRVEAWTVPSPKVSDGLIRSQSTTLLLHSKSNNGDDDTVPDNNSIDLQNRRQAVGALSTALLSGLLLSNSEPASAYEGTFRVGYDKTFPDELDTVDADPRTPRQKYLQEKAAKPKAKPLKKIDLATGSVLWGSALWFLTGSRSNPLVTPLANLLYSAEEEDWLKDRNDGLFAALPVPFLLVLGLVFSALGLGVHVAAISTSGGSVASSLQLAGVLLISSWALEIGRIASGEKKPTRDDYDRETMLIQEFEEFAAQRLKPGGNCHRSEVVQAFRRFNAKYRQADSEEYPLADLEIEQLLREWNQRSARAQRSSAGFYTGIQINTEADIVIGSN